MQVWHGLSFNPIGLRLLREACVEQRLKLFVPTESIRVRGEDRERALLPYAFVAGDVDRDAVRRIRCVSGFLRTPLRGYAMATEAQIVAMQTACGSLKRELRSGLRPGDRVRVRRLALGALEATVREIRGGRARIEGPALLGKPVEQWIGVDQLEAV